MFKEGIKVTLQLTINGQSWKILGGRIKDFSLQMHNYGFEANAEFWMYKEDEKGLFSAFSGDSLIEAELKLELYFERPKPAPNAIVAKGIVFERQLKERVLNQPDEPFVRYYLLRFCDAAQLFWTHHKPCKLFTEATMQDILDSEKGEKIDISTTWEIFTKQHPILFLGFPQDINNASFYDFILWYTHAQNGVWNYKHKENKYTIEQEKESSTALQLPREDVSEWRVSLPKIMRYNKRILNGYTENAVTTDIILDTSISDYTQDVYIRTAINKQLEEQTQLQKDIHQNEEHQVYLQFTHFPTVDVVPGTIIEFDSQKGWEGKAYLSENTYRSVSLTINASAERQDPYSDLITAYNSYFFNVHARLETQDEKKVNLPHFRIPNYKVYVEGKVVSDGDEPDETYQIYENEDTSEKIYRVAMPLWEDKQVIVPFEPNLFSGHIYFPCYKNSRVLIELKFQTAAIYRFLDWRLDSKLPQDTQGNSILLGLTEKSETAVKHVYEDSKPVFNMCRKNESDTQVVEFKEGIITIETKD
ncbi:hypothetical protein [Candidatus Uabimicrobium amorphum]|uniref:Uncharacterized protein n=1 Tax=Uabimicrobium amorphum TaxID=2596890 RepID=A0A5S9IRB2_UABAM|nr:hypothetical protein [Candidatus Uabimicrobium amorphum]BBM86659.1 hypothetical protein UABAM_05045 [Candidatus Uabimicrobium amorphum]